MTEKTEKSTCNLSTLNDVLFNQLRRLDDDELKGDALIEEMERAKTINGVANQIVSNARTVLDAVKFKAEYPGLGNSIKQLEKLS